MANATGRMKPKRKMGQTVRVKKAEYDELVAANELLCRILDDQGDLIDVYWHEHPDMMEAAGFSTPKEKLA